jgi:hypothetical protein
MRRHLSARFLAELLALFTTDELLQARKCECHAAAMGWG